MENPYTRSANLLVSNNITYQNKYYRGAWSKHKRWWLSFRSSAKALTNDWSLIMHLLDSCHHTPCAYSADGTFDLNILCAMISFFVFLKNCALAENCCTVRFSIIKLNNICIVIFFISKVVEKITAFAASDYGTFDAHIDKSYFNSIHLHRSKSKSPMKIILRVGEILCRISPY